MARFDRIIRILEQEKFRIIGKYTCDLADKDVNVMFLSNSHLAKEVNEAIEILKSFQINKRGRPLS